MAGESIISTLTEVVPAEFLPDILMQYQIDAMVVAPFAWAVSLPERSGKTFNFPQLVKDVATDITTEGTTEADATELETVETSVTVAQVALTRENSKLVERTNRYGADGLLAIEVRDAGMLLAEMVDDDLVALFGSITDAVGTSGADCTVANMLEAIAVERANNALGELAFVFDDQQANDVVTDLSVTGAAFFTGGNGHSLLSARANGHLGNFLGSEVVYTGLCDHGGGNVTGALIVRGDTNPERASLGYVRLWDAEMEEVPKPKKLTKERTWNSAYGVGLIGNDFSCEITTDE